MSRSGPEPTRVAVTGRPSRRNAHKEKEKRTTALQMLKDKKKLEMLEQQQFDDVYDVVNEREYNALRAERQDDDWLELDEGDDSYRSGSLSLSLRALL